MPGMQLACTSVIGGQYGPEFQYRYLGHHTDDPDLISRSEPFSFCSTNLVTLKTTLTRVVSGAITISRMAILE